MLMHENMQYIRNYNKNKSNVKNLLTLTWDIKRHFSFN